MALRPGDQWGALICLYAGKVDVKEFATDADDREYESESRTVAGYLLRCDCGKEWEVVKGEFQGKRVTRDCGCGRAGESGKSVVKAISMTNRDFDRINKFASEKRINFSHAARKLIEIGLGRITVAATVGGVGAGLDSKPWGGESDPDGGPGVGVVEGYSAVEEFKSEVKGHEQENEREQ